MEQLAVEFSDLNNLYKCYMAFIKEGGLFVVTHKKYNVGQSLALSVLLPNEVTPVVVTGKVVWLSPMASHSNAPQGIGINFLDDRQNLKDKIETLLGAMINSSEPTFTM